MEKKKIKVRLHGTERAIEQTKKDLERVGKVVSSSKLYKNRNDSNFRLYMELQLTDTKAK